MSKSTEINGGILVEWRDDNGAIYQVINGAMVIAAPSSLFHGLRIGEISQELAENCGGMCGGLLRIPTKTGEYVFSSLNNTHLIYPKNSEFADSDFQQNFGADIQPLKDRNIPKCRLSVSFIDNYLQIGNHYFSATLMPKGGILGLITRKNIKSLERLLNQKAIDFIAEYMQALATESDLVLQNIKWEGKIPLTIHVSNFIK